MRQIKSCAASGPSCVAEAEPELRSNHHRTSYTSRAGTDLPVTTMPSSSAACQTRSCGGRTLYFRRSCSLRTRGRARGADRWHPRPSPAARARRNSPPISSSLTPSSGPASRHSATPPAVAIIGERIVDVGAAERDRSLARRRPRRWSMPAAAASCRDSTTRAVRLVDGGLHLDGVDLHDAPSAAEMARRINERAKARPGEWITRRRLGRTIVEPAVAADSRASIDEVTNSSPVFVTRFDGTMALANAAAMGRAGITERTPDPPGGSLVRDGNGFPTGVLQGSAMDLVARVVPKTTSDDRARAIKRALSVRGVARHHQRAGSRRHRRRYRRLRRPGQSRRADGSHLRADAGRSIGTTKPSSDCAVRSDRRGCASVAFMRGWRQ